MNRKSFVRRLLGLAAATVAAPAAVQALIKEVEKPQEKPWMEYKEYYGHRTRQVKTDCVPGNILLKGGHSEPWYVTKVEDGMVSMVDPYGNKLTLQNPLSSREWVLMCSAMPER
jgi:hypothetical protein